MKTIIYVVADAFYGNNRAVFDNKEKCIDFLFSHYIEDNEDFAEIVSNDFDTVKMNEYDSYDDFTEDFYPWVRKVLTNDIQTFNGYEFVVDGFYLNEGKE